MQTVAFCGRYYCIGTASGNSSQPPPSLVKYTKKKRKPILTKLIAGTASQKQFSPLIARVADPNLDTNWIRIQLGQWIRIRNQDQDPGGQK